MKRPLLLFFMLLLSAINAPAQTETSASAYHKNGSVISAGYGIYNAWRRLFSVNAPAGTTYTVSAAGPATIVYEYAFTNRISGGVSLSYSKLKGILRYGLYKNTETLTNFSALLRANYHFGQSAKWDPYIGGGAGYYSFEYTSKDNAGGANSGSGLKIPGAFALSAQAGTKYYFNRHFGLFAELGYVAGSVGQVGATVKL
jgi:outer membrane protein W